MFGRETAFSRLRPCAPRAAHTSSARRSTGESARDRLAAASAAFNGQPSVPEIIVLQRSEADDFPASPDIG
jgi:hypothetical protein